MGGESKFHQLRTDYRVFPANQFFIQLQEKLQRNLRQNFLQIMLNQFGKDKFWHKGPCLLSVHISGLSSIHAIHDFTSNEGHNREKRNKASYVHLNMREMNTPVSTCDCLYSDLHYVLDCSLKSWQQAPAHSPFAPHSAADWRWTTQFQLGEKKNSLLCFFCYKRLWCRFQIVSSKTSASLRSQMLRVCVPMCLWKMFFSNK